MAKHSNSRQYEENQFYQYNRIKAHQIVKEYANAHPDKEKLQTYSYCCKLVNNIVNLVDPQSYVDEIIDLATAVEFYDEFEQVRKVTESSDELSTLWDFDLLPPESVNPEKTHSTLTLEDHSSAMASLSIKQPRSKRKKLILGLFILSLLDNEFSDILSTYFRWFDESRGIFVLSEQTGTTAIAELWGLAKNNDRMNYENLSRDLRAYRRDNKMIAYKARLHYQFNYDNDEVEKWRNQLKSTVTRKLIIESTKCIVDKWLSKQKNS